MTVHSTLTPLVNLTAERLFSCLKVNCSPTATAHFAQLTPVAWQELIEWAREQKVAALLYYRLRQHGLDNLLPETSRAQLKSNYQRLAVYNLTLYHHLRGLISALQAAGIPVILLKGGYLGGALYEEIALRQMVDVDLLVPPTALEATSAVLMALGYQPAQPIETVAPYLAHQHHLPPFVKANGISVEIHWTITRPNQSYAIDMADFWARAQPATVAGMTVSTLAPEDLLLHICLHATYHHYLEQDLRFLCDIDVICRHFAATFDWAQVVARAQQWGWARGVYLALQLAHNLLDTSIPPDVLQQLQPDQAAITQVEEARVRLSGAHVPDSYWISPAFCQVWEEKQLIPKIRKALQYVFLSRQQLASIYPAAPDSLKLYLYYPVRLKDLLVRYRHIFYELQQQQPEVTVYARKAALIAWLENGTQGRRPLVTAAAQEMQVR